MTSHSMIGNRIRELREEKKLTQEQLAQEFHVGRETVSLWERGERDIKTDITVKMADFFGVTCDYILRGINSEYADIYKTTGLSNAAIEKLAGHPTAQAIVRSLIESDDFIYLVQAIYHAYSLKLDLLDFQHKHDLKGNLTAQDIIEINGIGGLTILPLEDACRYFVGTSSETFQIIITQFIEQAAKEEALTHRQREKEDPDHAPEE